MTRDTLLLFDVDGTLTEPRKVVTPEMVSLLREARKHFTIAIVGGSDFVKQQEQLALMGTNIADEFDYIFSENGLVAYREGKVIARASIATHFGEENLSKILDFLLLEMSSIKLPIKRGTFIEYRNGMLNVSPIGRNCSQKEREDFEQYDKIHGIRPALAKKLETAFADLKLRCVIGGQISMDVFPQGWDKTYCLQFVEKDFNKGKIHFFGDKTFEGGNDYEIYNHKDVIGHSVKSFHDTMKLVEAMIAEQAAK